MNDLIQFFYSLVGLLVIFYIGLGWLIALEKKFHTQLPVLSLFSISFMLGIWGSAVFLYLLSLIQIPWNRWIILLILFSTSSAGYWYGISTIKSHIDDHLKIPKKELLTQLIPFVIGISMLIGLLYRVELSHDLMHSDNLAYWFLRGKIFYIDHGIRLDHLNNLPFNTVVPHPLDGGQPASGFIALQYPPFVPLAISMDHLIYNEANVINAKYLWLAVELVMYTFLWYIGQTCFPRSKWSGLISVLLLYTIPTSIFRFSIHNFGYADIWLGVFTLLGSWHLYEAFKSNRSLDLLLGGIFLSGAALCKAEGIILIYLAPVIIWNLRQKKNAFITSSAAIFLLFLPISWYVFASYIHTQTGFITNTLSHLQFNSANFLTALTEYPRILLTLSNQGFVWVAFYGLFVYRTIKRDFSNLSQFLLQSGAVIHIIFMILNYSIGYYPNNLNKIIEENSSRFLLQWSPTAILFIIINTSSLLCRGRDSNPHEG